MKNLKRLFALMLCLSMVFALAACGSNNNDANTDDQQQNEEQNNEEQNNNTELSEEEAWKLEPAYGETVHYWLSDGCTSAPAVADELGYFEELGLKAEGVKGDSDVEALGTGATDIAVGHIAKQLVPATNGVDLVFVGGAHTGCKSLYVLGDSSYQSTEDLKGLKISVPNGIGKSDYNITARLLDADGIDPLNDVELTPVETSACVPAMKNGEIAAALLSDTYAYHMVEDGTLRKVRSMLDEDINQICCAITMNGTFVKENPITAKKMVQAVKKALTWMNANPEECTDLLIKMGLNSDDREMNIEINKSLQFGPDDAYTESQLREIAEDYLRIGLCTTTDDADTIMSKYWVPLAPENE